MKYFSMPLKWNAITTYFSSSHLAIDLGWNNSHGGPNVDVFSVSSGTVVFAGNTNGTAGNMVKIRFDDKGDNLTWYFQYKHLSKISVKTGDKVSIGNKIGNMGGTGGYSPHLHFDVIKCPYGFVYEQEAGDNRKKYSVNPLDYCFLFPGQEVNEASKSKIIRLLGSDIKVARNNSKNQIQVIGYKLRCRKSYGLNGEFLGYIDYGIYNYSDIKTKDGYDWYKIGDGMWIANTKEDTVVYKKENVSNCDEYLKEIEELKQQILLQQQEIEKLKKELDDPTWDDYYVFTASKSDYFYIYLDVGDVVYYKKEGEKR